MGESQGAEDNVRGEGGEDADEEEGGEQDEGGGEHCGFEQGLMKFFVSDTNSGGEEGDRKCTKAA